MTTVHREEEEEVLMDAAPLTGCLGLGSKIARRAAPPSAARGSSTSGSGSLRKFKRWAVRRADTRISPLQGHRAGSHTHTHTHTHTRALHRSLQKGKTAFHVCFWLTALKDEPPLVRRIKRLSAASGTPSCAEMSACCDEWETCEEEGSGCVCVCVWLSTFCDAFRNPLLPFFFLSREVGIHVRAVQEGKKDLD